MKLASCLRMGLVALVLSSLAVAAQAAETVHLYLKVAGKDIQGESTQTSLGRAGSIECVQFQQAVSISAGGKSYEPIVIRKRIDKSSPALLKAATSGQDCEAVFKFFRPNPAGDGTTQQFYTVTLKGVRIAAIRTFVPNAMDPASSSYPPQEDVSFTFKTIQWTYTDGNVTAEDRWDGAAAVRTVTPTGR